MLLRATRLVLAGLALALMPSALFAADSIYDYDYIIVSTPKVEKILGSSKGWGERPDFFLKKSYAVYCYMEEDINRTAQYMANQVAAGATLQTRDVVELAESSCFAPFLEEAAKEKYAEDPFDLYSTDYTYDGFRFDVIRYVASCMWEADSDYFRTELSSLTDYKDIDAYLKEKHKVGSFDEIGIACFPAFVNMDEKDYVFRYNLIQQLLLRRNID